MKYLKLSVTVPVDGVTDDNFGQVKQAVFTAADEISRITGETHVGTVMSIEGDDDNS